MLNFFFEGGILFMTLISLAGLTALGLTIKVFMDRFSGKPSIKYTPNSIVVAGSLAFMLGILAQAIGIYQALIAIQAAGDVSPALIFGGFKVSLIAPLYGLFIFVITLIIWLVLLFLTPEKKGASL